ncbi:MAG: DUF3343 domain-containing protein [Spirochaetaceae bacterium]|jgi:hypothetical protein|nr:DUF3343 domain-containing protein [Spirochaetaceae bacterium]
MIDGRAGAQIEAVICFESVSQAIMAEQILSDGGFHVRVMPKPSEIKAGCGFCLRFLPDDIEKAAVFLSEHAIDVKETYIMIEEADGSVSYAKHICRC